MLGRYDGSYGLMLRGDGQGNFSAVDMAQSGLVIDGQVRDMKLVRGANGVPLIAVARNNDQLRMIRANGVNVGVAKPAPKTPNRKSGE